MSYEERSFNEYKEQIHGKWQKKIILISWLVSSLVFGIEIFSYFTFLKFDTKESLASHYVLIRIIIPSFLNFGVLVVATLVRKSRRYSSMTKTMWASFSIFMICSVLAIFHNYFHIMLVAPAVAFFICAVFGETKVLKRLLVLTIPVVLVSALTFWNDKNSSAEFYRVLTLICDLTFISCAYIFSSALMKTQAAQLSFIYETYSLQKDLIEELKIEPLTKLYNRVALEETINRILKKTKEVPINPFLVIMDIDFFKKVNDIYGHTSGDKVLVTLSEIIRKNMGSGRRAFRFGGEEFVLIFEDSMPSLVIYTVQAIRSDFEATRFDFAPELSITLSAGISALGPGFDSNAWIDSADKSLYFAKNNGRNQVKMSEIEY